MTKLDLLKEYIEVQANDEALWITDLKTIVEAYFQEELRRLAWLIEEADKDDIKEAIEDLKERIS